MATTASSLHPLGPSELFIYVYAFFLKFIIVLHQCQYFIQFFKIKHHFMLCHDNFQERLEASLLPRTIKCCGDKCLSFIDLSSFLCSYLLEAMATDLAACQSLLEVFGKFRIVHNVQATVRHLKPYIILTLHLYNFSLHLLEVPSPVKHNLGCLCCHHVCYCQHFIHTKGDKSIIYHCKISSVQPQQLIYKYDEI